MKKHPPSLASRRRASGLSLIEILVALALGLVLIAGATNLFLGSSQTFRVNESLSRMQEEARFAMNRIERDARSAGFRSCSPNVQNRVTGSGALLTEALEGLSILGWEFDDTGPGDSYTIDSLEVTGAGNWDNGGGFAFPADIDGDVVGGTDVLVINRVERLNTQFTDDNGPNDTNLDAPNHGVNQNAVILISNDSCTQASLVRKTNSADDNFTFASSGNTGNGVGFATNPQSELYHFQSRIYYVGLDGDVPGLYTRRLDGENGTANSRELVRGVENMQVLYGVANSSNATEASSYVPADEVTNWSNVVSVRIALLMRSGNEVSPDTNTRLYNLLGTEINPTGDGATGPVGDRYLRVLVTKTLGLRNRLR